MTLKGNITVEEGRREVETVGERNVPQIRVTIPYTFSGVDLTEFIQGSSADEESDSELADEAVSLAVNALRNHVIQFYGERFKEYPVKIANTQDFVGLDCDVSIFGIEVTEDLKSCSIEVEIHCFYDVPVSDLEEAIEGVKNSLLGK